LRARPRSGRPPTMLGALPQPLERLVDQAPLQPGPLGSQGSCPALATGFAQRTGGQRGRESSRGAFTKRRPLLPPHRATGSGSRCPRVCLCRTRGARVSGPPGRDGLALCRRNEPGALGAAPSWLVAPAQRYRLPPRPMSQRPIQHAAALSRPAWRRYRRWHRVPSGMWRSVMGAVH